jgi:hypothetical protein
LRSLPLPTIEKMKTLPILIFAFLVSCSPKNESENHEASNDKAFESKNSTEDIYSENGAIDSIRDPNHKAYYSDISIHEFALLILNDSVSPMDNEITFRLMDSINSTSVDTRNYYYPVFQHIADLSDGALAEAIGVYAMEYVSNYPDEFYSRYSCDDSQKLSCEQLISIAEFIQYEIGMQENIEEAWESFLEKIDTEKHKYPRDQLSIIFVDNLTNGLSDYME